MNLLLCCYVVKRIFASEGCFSGLLLTRLYTGYRLILTIVLFFLHLPTLSIEKSNARLIKKIIWISFYYNIMCQLYKDDDLLMLNKTLNFKTAILGSLKWAKHFSVPSGKNILIWTYLVSTMLLPVYRHILDTTGEDPLGNWREPRPWAYLGC